MRPVGVLGVPLEDDWWGFFSFSVPMASAKPDLIEDKPLHQPGHDGQGDWFGRVPFVTERPEETHLVVGVGVWNSLVWFTPLKCWLFYECSGQFSNPVFSAKRVAASKFPWTKYTAADKNARCRGLELLMYS